MRANSIEEERYKAAQKRVKEIKGFYIHLVVYVFVNISIIFMGRGNESILSSITDLSNYITAFFWGIGILAHWASVFGSNLFLGRKWEEQKIQELMKKEIGEKQKWE